MVHYRPRACTGTARCDQIKKCGFNSHFHLLFRPKAQHIYLLTDLQGAGDQY